MKFLKLIYSYTKILFICIFLGSFLMILVFSLPAAPMIENAYQSLPMLKREGKYSFIFNENDYKSRLDGFTDNLMINSAIFNNPEKSIIDKCFAIYSYRYPSDIFTEDLDRTYLSAYLEGKQNYNELPYYRYWHGYLVFLKPLLMFFDYGDIRFINSFMQIILFLKIISRMQKKQNFRIYIPAFIVTYFSLSPITLFMSLQFSSVTYVTLISSLLILYIDNINYTKFFFIIGIVTSYIDLFTFPLITLGIPLIFTIIKSNKSNIKNICIFVINWGAGYSLMWVSKWIIGSIIFKSNLILDAIQQFLFRSSHSAWGNKISFFDLLKINFSVYNGPFIWIFLCVLIFYIIILFKLKTFNIRQNQLYLFLLIALLPILWLTVTVNHSYIHFWYVHRILSIDIFAVLAWLAFSIQKCKSVKGYKI